MARNFVNLFKNDLEKEGARNLLKNSLQRAH